MAYGLGIDIGTSFTAAAVSRCDGGALAPPQPLTLGTRQSAVPSVLFVGDDGHVLIGEAAERRAATRPECVVRGFKRRMGDTVPIMAGTRSIAPADALAMMARWVVDRAQEREGAPPDAITLTHPAGWGEHKLGLLRRSLAGAGLADAVLLTEPEAAARHYASQRRVEAGSTVAVYDLGGGTFDAAVVTKRGADSFELLGRPEGLERLGGADFDEAVFEHVVSSLDSPLTDLDPADPEVLTALARVRRECTEAKEALSYDAEASIPVLIPGRQARVRLVRREFEGMIEGLVHRTIDALGQTLRTAHVDPGELAAILLVGGSSRVPLVAQLLSAEFDRPIAVDADPKASVCLGAAGSAADRLAPLGTDTDSGAGAGTNTGAGTGPEQGGGPPDHGQPVDGSRRLRRHPSSRTAQLPVAAASSAAAPATATPFTRPAPAHSPAAAPAHRPASGARLRVRVAGASALLAVVAVLTATAAQTPSGLGALAPLGASAQAGAPAGQSATPGGESPVQNSKTRRSLGGTAPMTTEGILLSATTPDTTTPDAITPDATASADEPSGAAAGQAQGAGPESPQGQHSAAGQSPTVSGASPQEAETPRAAPGPITPSSGAAGPDREAGPQDPGTPRPPAVPAPAPVPSADTVPPPAPAGPTAAPAPSPIVPGPPPGAPGSPPIAPEPASTASAPPPQQPTPSLEPGTASPAPAPGPGGGDEPGEVPAVPDGLASAPAPAADPPALQEG